jgi:hypothetical protein
MVEGATIPFLVISILLSTLNIILRILKSHKLNLSRLEQQKGHLEESLRSLSTNESKTMLFEDLLADTEDIFADFMDLYEELEFK